MTTAHAAEDALKVCLDEDLPPLSMHRRGKPDSGLTLRLPRPSPLEARPAAEHPMVRKQARRNLEPGAGSQCPALRRPLRAGRQLRVHAGLAANTWHEDSEAAGL